MDVCLGVFVVSLLPSPTVPTPTKVPLLTHTLNDRAYVPHTHPTLNTPHSMMEWDKTKISQKSGVWFRSGTPRQPATPNLPVPKGK